MRWRGIAVLVVACVVSQCGGDVESTLAMVKPDCVETNQVESIKALVNASGFLIITERMLRLEESLARNFYAEHSKREFFDDLVDFMTSGSVAAMVLQKHNAIAEWRELIGPTDPSKARVSHPQTLRAKWGIDTQRNCVHGSDSSLSAGREISLLFGGSRSTGAGRISHEEL
ncbi:hypothetical protein SELMODRAFT_162298 [Selaginella moellendorffii]|uniref:Nucleoside diphosphate kinase-like domain-containing protein n=1 Tax=Selaginella moellendorffii TaxID=88036 RepID=D8T9V9_SELML|nr:probable nucleoside diphosphate kinase 5 [Selaginella moellendorffii]EFJ06516.1 hypothetical protein SELMODRAFT_162298 [Selaginella moellendorffii]|eukprot:XP_002992366.1 probable nucleoside diphosphate kinase 5 [Selaginella moellendorffii]